MNLIASIASFLKAYMPKVEAVVKAVRAASDVYHSEINKQ